MANSEATIAQTKTIDTETLMRDDFDIETYIGAENSARLNLASGFIDKNEITSEIKMSEFLKNSGIAGNDDISAHISSARSLLNEKTSSGLWSSVKEGWNNNKIQIEIADVWTSYMKRQITLADAQEQVDRLKMKIKDTKAKGFASWAKSAANIAPMMVETTRSSAKLGILSGVTAAGAAAVAGQVPPITLLPEEAITVPGAMVTFGGYGLTMGMVQRGMELEAGLMLDELFSMTDEQGNKIDPAIAEPIAVSVGIINGILDLAQIQDVIQTIPGGKKLLGKARNKTLKKLIKSKSLRSVFMRGTAKYAGHVGFETGTEVLQEADNIIFGEFGKSISNQLDKTDFDKATKDQIVNRLVDIAKESAKGFSVIAGPGNLINMTGEAVDVKLESVQRAAEGVTEPVKRVSRIMPSDAIKPRIDIKQFGKTMVDVPVELPTKKERVIKPKEIILTPEEEYQLKQSESTLKAEEPYTIKPNLYIGNVTQRMKKVFAGEFGTSPEDVHGFLEGAFPTKRTPVELTMGEARTLLNHLESSLDDRFDKNQINTHADMAKANADWGDIKELRKSLGLPEVQRPFSIIREQKTEVITIENVKERIQKSVQPSKAAKIDITHIDRLNAVMKRVAKFSKEGYALGKSDQKKLYAELQYLRKQEELRQKLIDKISREPVEKIDYFYREAIKSIQDVIDFKTTTEAKKISKESIRSLIAKNPDKANEISRDVLDAIDRKDVADLSFTDLLTINEEVKRLSNLGKLKSELYRKQRARALDALSNSAINNVKKAAKNIFPSAERANTLRPGRIFDMLDGGKDYKGEIYDFFYQQTNEDYDSELRNTDNRHIALKSKRDALGISLRSLAKKRIINDIKFTVDELLTIYAGWKNPESQATLKYGGIVINSQESSVLIDDVVYKSVEDALTDKEKLWADTITSEYNEHWDRIRTTVIRAENRDPGNVINYTPIRRVGIEYETSEQEILDELALRHFFRKEGPHKNFTISRKDVPNEYQRPMKSGLTKMWFQEVRKQEHYANNAIHIKDMQALNNKEEFRNSVTERFGKPVYDRLKDYVKGIANPDFYRTFNDIEQISKILRRHTAIAYIAFNVSSYLKQIPSIMMYWAHSSVGDIIKSTLDAAFHPMQTYESAKNIHYQISHAMIEREMAELERVDSVSYKKIIDTVGRVGMYGIFAIDRATRVIGINAVYNKALRDGLSPSEAARKAATVTLRVQEAASPKDLAKIYSSNEILNWFTMFTNQLNQLYNVTTYDIPASWRNKNYSEAARSAIAMASMAMMIWMIENGELPDEPEDAASALSDQTVSTIPIVGNYIVAGAKGWSGSGPAPLKAANSLGRAGMSAYNQDWEKFLLQLIEPLAIGTGFPYQGTKDAIKLIEED